MPSPACTRRDRSRPVRHAGPGGQADRARPGLSRLSRGRAEISVGSESAEGRKARDRGVFRCGAGQPGFSEVVVRTPEHRGWAEGRRRRFLHRSRARPDLLRQLAARLLTVQRSGLAAIFAQWLRQRGEASQRSDDRAARSRGPQGLRVGRHAFGTRRRSFPRHHGEARRIPPQGAHRQPRGMLRRMAVDPLFHGPVLPTKIAVDPSTGLKAYIATRGRGFRTVPSSSRTVCARRPPRAPRRRGAVCSGRRCTRSRISCTQQLR